MFLTMIFHAQSAQDRLQIHCNQYKEVKFIGLFHMTVNSLIPHPSPMLYLHDGGPGSYSSFIGFEVNYV